MGFILLHSLPFFSSSRAGACSCSIAKPCCSASRSDQSAAQEKTLMGTMQQTGVSIGGVVEQFENVLPKSQAEVSVVQQRLIRAGYRKESAIKVFYGAKVLVPVSLCLLALVTGLGSLSPFFVYVLCLGLGFLAPDFWLGRMISKRQRKIRRGLPDVLDLLVICIEAGLEP